MEKSYAQMLVAYNRWATGKIMAQAAELSPEEFAQPISGLSFGNLHGTLVHIASGETGWLPRWQNEAPGARFSTDDLPDFAAVKAQLDKIEAEQAGFVDAATEADFAKEAALPGQPPAKMKPASYLITHTIFHSMQFRAEAAVALTALGHSPGGIDMAAFLQEYAG